MDPNAAYATAADPNADTTDRIEALVNLEQWIAEGGFPPRKPRDNNDLPALAMTLRALADFAKEQAR